MHTRIFTDFVRVIMRLGSSTVQPRVFMLTEQNAVFCCCLSSSFSEGIANAANGFDSLTLPVLMHMWVVDRELKVKCEMDVRQTSIE